MVSASHVRLAPVGFAGSSQETSKLSSLQYCMVTTYMILWERWHALHCCKTFIEPQPHNPIIKSDCIYLYIYICQRFIYQDRITIYIYLDTPSNDASAGFWVTSASTAACLGDAGGSILTLIAGHPEEASELGQVIGC